MVLVYGMQASVVARDNLTRGLHHGALRREPGAAGRRIVRVGPDPVRGQGGDDLQLGGSTAAAQGHHQPPGGVLTCGASSAPCSWLCGLAARRAAAQQDDHFSHTRSTPRSSRPAPPATLAPAMDTTTLLRQWRGRAPLPRRHHRAPGPLDRPRAGAETTCDSPTPSTGRNARARRAAIPRCVPGLPYA